MAHTTSQSLSGNLFAPSLSVDQEALDCIRDLRKDTRFLSYPDLPDDITTEAFTKELADYPEDDALAVAKWLVRFKVTPDKVVDGIYLVWTDNGPESRESGTYHSQNQDRETVESDPGASHTDSRLHTSDQAGQPAIDVRERNSVDTESSSSFPYGRQMSLDKFMTTGQKQHKRDGSRRAIAPVLS
ncbi:MAG: hypothetical protein TREMPRED_000004 [Tremellales sp. Tagirdzhanova-0007]|nr:MAG: hypothetical protein TREMPRED_000004 [Tremellales sp. Tagirdzhanova-0007]